MTHQEVKELQNNIARSIKDVRRQSFQVYFERVRERVDSVLFHFNYIFLPCTGNLVMRS